MTLVQAHSSLSKTPHQRCQSTYVLHVCVQDYQRWHCHRLSIICWTVRAVFLHMSNHESYEGWSDGKFDNIRVPYDSNKRFCIQTTCREAYTDVSVQNCVHFILYHIISYYSFEYYIIYIHAIMNSRTWIYWVHQKNVFHSYLSLPEGITMYHILSYTVSFYNP